jgi:hypothetical protein
MVDMTPGTDKPNNPTIEIPTWSGRMEVALLPITAPYRSPRAVASAPRVDGQQLRVEVTLLCGWNGSFQKVPIEHRRMVRTIAGTTTIAELLAATTRAFNPPSSGHYGELRIRNGRGRAPRDETTWHPPVSRQDTVLLATPVDCIEDWAGCHPGWDVPVSRVLGQGDVAYLRCDYAEEWCWRVRVVAAGAAATGKDIGPFIDIAVMFDDDDDTDR